VTRIAFNRVNIRVTSSLGSSARFSPKALAKEVATRGILVYAVAPAVIETGLLQQVEKSTLDSMIARFRCVG
jgi:hypothetical protein